MPSQLGTVLPLMCPEQSVMLELCTAAVCLAGLTAYIAWLHTHFGINPADVFIQKTPTNFDASVDELWAALAAGATLVVAPPEAHRDVHTVMDLITRWAAGRAAAVPSTSDGTESVCVCVRV